LSGAENIAYKNDRRALSKHINCHLFGSCGIWSGRHGYGRVYLCICAAFQWANANKL